MQYQKPSLTHQEQIALLRKRGLFIDDDNITTHYLQNISYYRLSAYFKPFQSNNCFKVGTSFDDIVSVYTFDRKLRLLILEAIEPIEVAFRTQIIDHLGRKYGAFGYLEKQHFSAPFIHPQLIDKLRDALKKSSETFIKHFKQHYPLSKDFPIWMALEVASFGNLSRLFENMKGEDQQVIATHYNLHDTVLISWFHTLAYTRNLCAHHSRFWNRTLTFRPKLPAKSPLWKEIKNDRIYCLLAMMQYLLKYINPNSTWADRLKLHLTNNLQISLATMGFPYNWLSSPLWGTDGTLIDKSSQNKDIITILSLNNPSS